MRGLHHKGFVLIFTLWVLGILTVLAVGIAAGIRQKIILAQKLEEHSRMQNISQAAYVQASTYVRQQMQQGQFIYTPALKANIHNNPNMFGQIILGDDHAQLGCGQSGVVDEERKININTTNALVLSRLLGRVLAKKYEEANVLALAMLDWRKWGESTLTGFYSDEYYSNLQYPYKKKDADYESLDELLLVQGMDRDIYDQILPFVTIYGDGKVNINTAPPEVLFALGLDDETVEKLLQVRRGKDEVEATLDDHVFTRTFDVASDVVAVVKLKDPQVRALDGLNLQGALAVNSYHFTVCLEAGLAHSLWTRKISAAFAPREGKLLYWREK